MNNLNNETFPWLSYKWFLSSTFKNFTWDNPNLLYLIPLVPVLFLLIGIINYRSKLKLNLTFPDSILRVDFIVLLRFLPLIFFSLSLIMIIVALSRPQKTDRVVEQYSEGIDIILILDISKSMDAKDFKPNRLEAAKKVAQSFIDGRMHDRIGIVVFSGEAFSLSPLTSDYRLLKTYIKEINFDMIQLGGTAIGSAISVGINRMKESKTTSKVMILISDGDNNAGSIDPFTAAKLASAFDIKIYSILMGKDGDIPIGKDMYGNIEYVKNSIDPTTMSKISEIASGRFYLAPGNEQLIDIFNKIDKLERTKVRTNNYNNIIDYYGIYLTWAIIFYLLWFLTKISFLNNFLQD